MNRRDDIEISARQAAELWKEKKIKLLDVRGEDERAIAAISGVPMLDRKLAQEIVETWPKDAPIVFHCHHGIRSLEAVWHLSNQGFTNVKSMAGGIDAWSCEVDPKIPRY